MNEWSAESTERSDQEEKYKQSTVFVIKRKRVRVEVRTKAVYSSGVSIFWQQSITEKYACFSRYLLGPGMLKATHRVRDVIMKTFWLCSSIPLECDEPALSRFIYVAQAVFWLQHPQFADRSKGHPKVSTDALCCLFVLSSCRS